MMKLLARLFAREQLEPEFSSDTPPSPTACRSPEVQPDRRIVFRVHAPRARHVTLEGLPGLRGQTMSRHPDGVWHATIGPLRPGIYNYFFKVDGASFTDPRNPRTQRWLVSNSMLEVPGDDTEAWARRTVPHGVVHRHRYHSPGRHEEVAFQVYTPPGYRDSSGTALPVLYLLHGFGDDERAWEEIGLATRIADNLIADQSLKPCVIVMPHGHPVAIHGPGTDAYFENNAIAMEAELVDELLPMVEALFRIRADPASRAIAGLSMGGGHALRIGLRRPDLFSAVGAFSAKTPLAGLDDLLRGTPGQTGAASPSRRLLWIGCGHEDALFGDNQRFAQALDDHAMKHDWVPTAGGHDWSVWREYLARTLPLLIG